MYGFEGITGEKYKLGETAPNILVSEFTLLGYNVLTPKVLDASDYGVPQRRKRAIFIASKNGESVPKYSMPTIIDGKRLPYKMLLEI